MNETSPQPKVNPFRKWLPLAVLSLALTIIILDTTILNVSLRTIINDLHTNIQSIQWVITAYSLMIAAFTITGGRLGDLFGRKKMFVAGALIFAIGSFMTSISQSVGFMIAGEAIVEGIGASLMLPATTSLLVSTYKGADRRIGFGIWGSIAGGAAALGPVIGGWLTTYASWRWAFRVNVGVALLLVIGSFFIAEVRDKEEKPTLDYVGVILSVFGMFSIVFGVIQSSAYGWLNMNNDVTLLGYTFAQGTYSPVIPFILFGLGILSVFLAWENHVMQQGRAPLVSLKLFSNQQFTTGILITAILGLGQAGLFFAIPVFLQSVKHLDALNTGFAMLPMTLSLLVASLMSAALSKKFSPKHIVQAGLLLNALGFVVLWATLSVNVTVLGLTPGFMLFGIGMGLIVSVISNITLSAVSVQEAGEASGVNGTMRQVGSTLGSAIIGAILISSLGNNLVSGINASTVIPNDAKASIGQAVSQQASSIEFGSSSTATSQLPPAITAELTTISEQATVDANKTTFLFGSLFILGAFLISLRLPKGKNIETEKSVASVARAH